MKTGRPSKLTEDIIEQARNYCKLGATDVELAEFFGVSASTIYNWKLESPEFLESTKIGKEAANARVGHALYTKALGYDKDGRHYPADTTSIIFWLKNRDPENWRDVKERINTHINEDDEIDMTDLARRMAYVLTEAMDGQETITH